MSITHQWRRNSRILRNIPSLFTTALTVLIWPRVIAIFWEFYHIILEGLMAIIMSLVYNQKMSSEDGASEMMTVEREDAPQWRKNVAALTDRSMLKYYIVAVLGALWFFFR